MGEIFGILFKPVQYSIIPAMPSDPELIDTYISIDIETAGPNPSQYAMLSIGACALTEPRHTFYIELKPDKDSSLPEALDISKLSMEKLAAGGVEPKIAMQHFADWLLEVVPAGQRPLFVAFNAPFDWMFVNDYFQRYLGYNPFGHAALDIKSYFMGLDGVLWSQTSMRNIGPRYRSIDHLSHNALQDAIDQANIFEKMLAKSAQNTSE
ncbi:MAG TPA: DNA polymerase III subunit epsilon [Anaerolineae bacterium]|nr:DNA polymerase III subunit epsilon [Anaerolineae bacterium]